VHFARADGEVDALENGLVVDTCLEIGDREHRKCDSNGTTRAAGAPPSQLADRPFEGDAEQLLRLDRELHDVEASCSTVDEVFFTSM
jgi:hypothetical protein